MKMFKIRILLALLVGQWSARAGKQHKVNTFLCIFSCFLKETKNKYTREHMAAGLVWERLNWLKEMPLSHSKALQLFAAHFLLKKWMMWAHIKQKLHDQISEQDVIYTSHYSCKCETTLKWLTLALKSFNYLDLLMELSAGELASAHLSAVLQMQAQQITFALPAKE